MINKLKLLENYHNNYWIKYHIGQALIGSGDIHSMVHTRMDGIRTVFNNVGHPYNSLVVMFFDNHSSMFKRGLIELGSQPGAVNARACLMATMEKQLIVDVVKYTDEGIGQEQACLAMVNNLSSALMDISPNQAVQGPSRLTLVALATNH